MTDESEGLELCRRGAFSQATEWVIRIYGTEIAAYLLSLESDRDAAQDVFAECCAAIWQGLPRFRGECSLRTYGYAVARRQWARARRNRGRRHEVPLDQQVEAIAARLRTTTAEYLRTEPRDRLAELRAQLEEDDRALLSLRLNSKLGWSEIARVVSDSDSPTDEDLSRTAAALRKRYERLKEQFRKQLRAV